ncbi:hypothetical protein R9X47_21185 [Wukongibacter baidiensis]|uniref:hypothetical protein n=1 Tax=Wukongibacter baidiensis TaxID=1723361 RepID=UPI003D7F4C88
MEINLLVPLKNEEEIIEQYRKTNKGFLRLKKNISMPRKIELVYKPYYFHRYSYNVKSFKKAFTEEIGTLTDGLSSISALLKDSMEISKINNIPREKVLEPKVSEKESEENSLGIVQKNMYMRYKHYYKCNLVESQIIYRGFYLLELDGRNKPMILHGDFYEIK